MTSLQPPEKLPESPDEEPVQSSATHAVPRYDDGLSGHDKLFPQLPYTISDRSDKATRDIQLQQFVNNATFKKDEARKATMTATFGQRVDDVRTLAGEIKQHALDHLDHYLEQWIDNATAAGTQVHFARDGEQANAIALEIAKQIDAKTCVKSKSMVTEETHLLPDLEKTGVETVETDLGEFILQIDNDAPSHIVTPMIHKDRVATAKAFQRVLGAPYTEDEKELCMIARGHLRQKYRDADLGISGGNFLCADTGSVVICTNEGNGRFCTSAPKTHIAFVGIEKLVPNLQNLAVLLKVLTRSSTGQPLTVYTHHMTGPRRDHEPDGPEQMHVILVDNGRSEVLKEETREMLRCIRCGACLNTCPVYRKIGGHSYGAVYSGPIGAILTPALQGLHNYPDLPHASSLCGACYEACPVKINIPKYLIQLRRDLVSKKLAKPGERLLMRTWAAALRTRLTHQIGGWSQKTLFRLQSKLGGTMGTSRDPYSNRGWVNKAPGQFGGWTKERDLPTPTARSFRYWWNHEHRN